MKGPHKTLRSIISAQLILCLNFVQLITTQLQLLQSKNIQLVIGADQSKQQMVQDVVVAAAQQLQNLEKEVMNVSF